jgi:hypothetical protein
MYRFIRVSTEIRNFDGSDSDRRIFLFFVEQLQMNTNIFSVKLYFGSLIFTLLRHYQYALFNNFLNGGFNYDLVNMHDLHHFARKNACYLVFQLGNIEDDIWPMRLFICTILKHLFSTNIFDKLDN